MADQIISADLTWVDGGFERDIQVRTDTNGRIADVGKFGAEPTRRLPGRALMPGFVNAHSHAFQRGLRGRGETFPAGSGTFWSWREAMYGLVGNLDQERLFDLCKQAFLDMLAAGMTTVGEFHYLHHLGSDQDPAGDRWAADRVVIEAAREARIRLVLLVAFYRTGGIGKPLDGAQQRFATPDVEDYWRHLDRLIDEYASDQISFGVVAHSIRAVPLDDLVELRRGALARGLPFHMHVEEQRQEIVSCGEAYGKTPMAVLNEHLEVDGSMTSVHCTHTDSDDMRTYLEAGGRVCICPLTEANLADGIADLPTILDAGGPTSLCLGSDSNARIAMLEEARWLEYVQRLALERRGVCADETGQVGRVLLDIATRGGAAALGLEAGAIETGRVADFVALDLRHTDLAEVATEHLDDALVFGAGSAAISRVCVGGRWIV